MNAIPALLLSLSLVIPAFADPSPVSITPTPIPSKLFLVDGRVLDHVTSAQLEDGKIKVIAAGGPCRLPVSLFTTASQQALGLITQDATSAVVFPVPDIKTLTTIDGKVFTQIRSIRVTPSFISFVYQDGSASVRFDQLSESLQKQFHYDPVAAAQFDEKQRALALAQAATDEKYAHQQQVIAANKEAREYRQQLRNEQFILDAINRPRGYYYYDYDIRSEALHNAARARATIGLR